MARIPVPSKVIRGFQYVLENDFTGGLKTEYTGLNFPENACTSTENCVFFHTGAVFRRSGFDYEVNFSQNQMNRTNKAISSFRWLNAGGDGETQIYVLQVGSTLSFYESSNATISSPLSGQLLASTVNLSNFIAQGAAPVDAIECQYAYGNGYLFVFHPSITPIYCVFSAGIITPNRIDIDIRDFIGNVESGVPDNLRPGTLNIEHHYNLQNQGWSEGPTWSTTSNTGQVYYFTTPVVWTFYGVSSTLNANAGDVVNLHCDGVLEGQALFPAGMLWQGVVVNYNPSGGALTINVTANIGAWTDAAAHTAGFGQWVSADNTFNIYTSPQNAKIELWNTQIGNYPSNADVWWSFKDQTEVFNPEGTIANVTLGSGPAPKGSYILDAFNMDRSAISGIAGFNPVVTTKRPKTGAWFQGRVWYTGVDDAITEDDVTDPTLANTIFYTWSENIYFSQIIDNTSQFGKCYQTNDPTSETLFDLLPSDGGVITIQGSGSIYKLFPITNGLLVFAANGIWFITGSTGIGFDAVDYTITKLSAITSISSTSYIDILGYPMFWNEEGIYSVGIQSQQQGLSVDNLTLNTIKQFYDAIPLQSKKFARGSYNPITGQVQWVYRSTNETDVTSRYQFDSMLTLSMFTQAFYPWNVPATNSSPWIHDVVYVVGPGGSTSPYPIFKYLTSDIDGSGNYQFTFSEERDDNLWMDWNSTGNPIDYTSSFNTGYRLHGDAQRRWQPVYVYVYSSLDPLKPITPSFGPPQFLVWDNSGNVYSSSNLGVTWTTSSTPHSADTWNDVAMATNAGDWNTIVGFDSNYNLGSGVATGFSSVTGQTGSWSLGFPGLTGMEFGYSGAVSAGGSKILALPASFPSQLPQISTNKGSTWSNLSVPSGRGWNVACMDSTAKNMYMTWLLEDASAGGIIKSSDGGSTWNDLVSTTSIPITHNYSSYCAQRIRCTPDGQTFVYVDTEDADSLDPNAYISLDGGATITSFIDNLPGTHFTTRTSSDCGISDDGTVIVVGFGSVFSFRCYLAISKDSGNTWTQLTPPNFLNDPVNSGHALQTCTLSPDGQSIVAVYQDTDGVGDYLVDISIDQGVTWTSSTITPNGSGSTPVATYIIQP